MTLEDREIERNLSLTKAKRNKAPNYLDITS
jgi:hypothetical protein